MTQQSKEERDRLMSLFPASISIVKTWKDVFSRFDLQTHIQASKPSPATMHLQAHNITAEMNAYVQHENGNRGLRYEYLSAINSKHKIVATLRWDSGDLSKMAKDIFAEVSPNTVEYLLWVRAYA